MAKRFTIDQTFLEKKSGRTRRLCGHVRLGSCSYLRCAFHWFVLVYLPGRFLSWSGIVAPETTGAPQVAGMIIVTIGTVIALWCVFTFVFIGEGTPAPFDPPRKLMIRGPYRVKRLMPRKVRSKN